jgi:hypothetical protein
MMTYYIRHSHPSQVFCPFPDASVPIRLACKGSGLTVSEKTLSSALNRDKKGNWFSI